MKDTVPPNKTHAFFPIIDSGSHLQRNTRDVHSHFPTRCHDASNLQLPNNPSLRLQRQTSNLHPRQSLRLPQRRHVNLNGLLEVRGCKGTISFHSVHLLCRVRRPCLGVFADILLGDMSRSAICPDVSTDFSLRIQTGGNGRARLARMVNHQHGRQFDQGPQERDAVDDVFGDTAACVADHGAEVLSWALGAEEPLRDYTWVEAGY